MIDFKVLSQRQGLYVAPKIQGVYHITATSTTNPQKRAVATVTVLACCDLPGALNRTVKSRRHGRLNPWPTLQETNP
jgi:hypothetical protein